MSSKTKKKKRSSKWYNWQPKREFSERNQKLIDEMNARPRDYSIMEVLSKWRMITYGWIVFFPPYGLYRVWCGESNFRRSEKVVWTFMIICYVAYFLKLILFS